MNYCVLVFVIYVYLYSTCSSGLVRSVTSTKIVGDERYASLITQTDFNRKTKLMLEFMCE